MHTPAPSSTIITDTCVDSQTPILLQTEKQDWKPIYGKIFNGSTSDSGSQRTYVTKSVQNTLSQTTKN